MSTFYILIAVWTFSSGVHGEEGFYNIAHMTNTPASVDWALDKGANGVEIDLTFDTSTGTPMVFRHSVAGEACDCTCMCPAPVWELCRVLYPNSVCAKLLDDVSGISPCRAESPLATMLTFLAKKSSLALIYIDNKIKSEDMDSRKMKIAGEAVVSTIITNLFEKGYGGKVLVGSSKLETFPFLKAAVGAIQSSKFRNRVYFALDQENVEKALRKLHTLPTRNIVYGTGLTACLPMRVKDTLQLAAVNKAKGVTGLTYVWTIDKYSSIKENLPYVQAVLSNYPGIVNQVLQDNGIQLASQSSSIPVASSSDVITSLTGLDCDCDYHPGGCSISKPASSGLACHCEYKGFWTCGGSVSQCSNPDSYYCTNPDYSVASCLLGYGDCEGYKTATCDCDYSSGGCTISKVPPPNTACRCSYKGGWTCGGSVTKCKYFKSRYCKNPDYSINTCNMGGGDCGGY
ncbi:dermonecrotic toxin LamSicTox-alphaIV1ii-like [Mercenaria mercenaria]|uniref:dermonecrotic toxin LamSicTox-alphaIV1ii-like n=1 Tax=Mercenaria mercenaria TaxID=6596 RepID=UPI00234EB9AF|nr:dermonecrotic toxin LamSicTox-alphaIV1ii-like [Mercenaria mercenaria]